MTESLTQKIEAMAEAYATGNHRTSMPDTYEKKAYIAGASDLHKILLEGGLEWNDKPVQAWFNVRPFERIKNFRELDFCIDAAQFQHAQDLAYLVARDAEIERLKGEVEKLKEFIEKPRLVVGPRSQNEAK